MYAIRKWSVRQARALERFYAVFETLLIALRPLWNAVGYGRVEKPMAAAEKVVKGLLFDCQMCGQCVLSSTGMACPMNCPKQLRNGPCGGVRADGNCEVQPEMKCVWVEAYNGSRAMRDGEKIMAVQPPVDHTRRGKSAWLREARNADSVKIKLR